MWAYKRFLNVTAIGRSFVLSSVVQKSPSVTKCAFSSAPLPNIHVSALRPLFITTVFRVCVQGKILKKDIHLSQLTQRAVETNQAKDVTIFKYDNQKLYHLITIFGIVNYLMFMLVSTNIYSLLNPPSKKEQGNAEFDSENGTSFSPAHPERKTSVSTNPEASEGSGGVKLLISSPTLLKALCGVTFFLGSIILAGSWFYCNHAVRYIVLRKGGQKVTVVTHGFFARNRYHTWDIEKVSCRGNRAISSAVLLNAKGKYFSFILDKRGTYTNPQLFDATVGVLRDLKN